MTVINQKLDEILEFLHGDKKAELISAIRFTREAYENFSSIMEHGGQRNATMYLRSVKNSVGNDISRSEKRMTGDFNALKASLSNANGDANSPSMDTDDDIVAYANF